MKIVEFKCPACGASLKADISRDVMYCEYCGKKLILDDEAMHVKMTFDNAREAGYEFEQGRMNAQSNNIRSEVEKIQRMLEAFPEYERLINRYNVLTMEYRMSGGDYIEIRPLIKWIILCVILLLIIKANIQEFTSTHNPSKILVVLLCIAIITLIVCFQFYKQVRKKEKQEKAKKQRDYSKEELDIILKNSGLDTIPERYRTMECLDYFHSSLINQESFTISQAIRSYERYQHQLMLAEQSRQQLEIQRQQLQEMKEMNEMLNERLNEDDDDDDSNNTDNGGNVLGTIAAIGLGVLVGRAIFKDD